MSRRRMTIEFDVDTDALEELNREAGTTQRGLPEDMSDWDPSDLLFAAEQLVVDLSEATAVEVE